MLGDLVSAGANIVGGLINRESSREATNATKKIAEDNRAQQYLYATNGIQWKVADAKAAGIHPIYALGSQGASYTPVTANFSGDTSLGNSMANAGQDLGRAINATRSESQRVDAFTRAAQALQLEKGTLENQLLRQELASKAGRLRADQSGPPMAAVGDNFAVPGQVQSGLVKPSPLEVVPGHPKQPHSEGGAVTDLGYGRTGSGYVPVPSKDMKERIEDDFIQQTMWAIRNNILPSIGMNRSPPPIDAPPGKEWVFNPFKQQYEAATPFDRRKILSEWWSRHYPHRPFGSWHKKVGYK